MKLNVPIKIEEAVMARIMITFGCALVGVSVGVMASSTGISIGISIGLVMIVAPIYEAVKGRE